MFIIIISVISVNIISVNITTPLYIVQCQFKCEHKSIWLLCGITKITPFMFLAGMGMCIPFGTKLTLLCLPIFFPFYFQIHSCSEESISLEALLFSWHNELVDCFCQTRLSINKTTWTLDGPDHARRQEARRCLEVWFASMATHFCVYFYTSEDQFFLFL